MTPKDGIYTNNSLLIFDMYNNEKIVGDLAERWDVAPDGKQISFALRQGVKLHDRSDFTCADAYSLEKLADPTRLPAPLVGDGQRPRQRIRSAHPVAYLRHHIRRPFVLIWDRSRRHRS